LIIFMVVVARKNERSSGRKVGNFKGIHHIEEGTPHMFNGY